MRRDCVLDYDLLQAHRALRHVKLRAVQVLAGGLGEAVLQKLDGRGDAKQENERYLRVPVAIPWLVHVPSRCTERPGVPEDTDEGR